MLITLFTSCKSSLYVSQSSEESLISEERVYAVQSETFSETTTTTQSTTIMMSDNPLAVDEEHTILVFNNNYTTTNQEVLDIPANYMITDVPLINQYSVGLPTGCEIVSATMVLNHLGYDITATEACDYLRQAPHPEYNDGIVTGYSPTEYFIGNPAFSSSYGCYAPVIVDAMNDIISAYGGSYNISDITNCYSDELFYYVSQDIPVIVWATDMMLTPFIVDTWVEVNSGERVEFIAREHCLVLTGYDEDKVYFNCPQYGKVTYDKEVFMLRWRQLGCQAIVVLNQ